MLDTRAVRARLGGSTRRLTAAFIATMTPLADISSAPIAGESTHPHDASTPAASGIAMMFQPAGGPLRGNFTMPRFGTLVLTAHRGLLPDCARR